MNNNLELAQQIAIDALEKCGIKVPNREIINDQEANMLIMIALIISVVVTVASAIAAVTPTPKDDKWIGKLYKIIDVFALNIGKAKNKPGK